MTRVVRAPNAKINFGCTCAWLTPSARALRGPAARAMPKARKPLPKPKAEADAPSAEEAVLELPEEDFIDPNALASPDYCRVYGISDHNVNTVARFVVEACVDSGRRKPSGGDAFFIAIRGASRVRGRVTDNQDGTYTIAWKPIVSGTYYIAVSLFGNAIAGSPFQLMVHDPGPYAPKCEVKGAALHHITARTNSSFDIRYRDRSGNLAQAVELDVYVMPVDDDSPMLWDAATHAKPAEAEALADTTSATAGGTGSDKKPKRELERGGSTPS